MSTGADCRFYEREDGWRYDLQKWPYGENPDYDTFGPFEHFGQADQHLSDNHANPGGFTTDRLPCDHPQEHRRAPEFRANYDWTCWHCGTQGGDFHTYQKPLNGSEWTRKYSWHTDREARQRIVRDRRWRGSENFVYAIIPASDATEESYTEKELPESAEFF